jgi:hypothetical protein
MALSLLTALYLLLVLFGCITIPGVRANSHTSTDGNTSSTSYYTRYTYDSSITLSYDPPYGFFSSTVLGVYVYCNEPTATIYVAEDGNFPKIGDATTYSRNASSPYIQLNTPFGVGRQRTITIVAVVEEGQKRSLQYKIKYFVEGSDRPASYGFLVPGVESNGTFLGFAIEMNATARAQSSGE